MAGGIEFGSLTDLFTSKALAADGDALLTEHRGHPGFGDAAASTDLLRRVSGLVFLPWALRSMVAARLDSTASLKISVNEAVDGVAPATTRAAMASAQRDGSCAASVQGGALGWWRAGGA